MKKTLSSVRFHGKKRLKFSLSVCYCVSEAKGEKEREKVLKFSAYFSPPTSSVTFERGFSLLIITFQIYKKLDMESEERGREECKVYNRKK